MLAGINIGACSAELHKIIHNLLQRPDTIILRHSHPPTPTPHTYEIGGLVIIYYKLYYVLTNICDLETQPVISPAGWSDA